MENKDIRWQQRFINFNKAFNQFEKFVNTVDLNDLEKQGLIKSFEYTFELGWKTLQDVIKEKGYSDIVGPRPVIEQSFKDGYLTNGNGWMRMLKSRNLTSHTYDEQTAEEIIENIHNEYYLLLKDLLLRLENEK